MIDTTHFLKLCPYCNKPAELELDNDHHGEWFNLGCPDADCPGRWAYYTQDIDDLEASVAKWNNRPEEQRLEEKIVEINRNWNDVALTLRQQTSVAHQLIKIMWPMWRAAMAYADTHRYHEFRNMKKAQFATNMTEEMADELEKITGSPGI